MQFEKVKGKTIKLTIRIGDVIYSLFLEGIKREVA